MVEETFRAANRLVEQCAPVSAASNFGLPHLVHDGRGLGVVAVNHQRNAVTERTGRTKARISAGTGSSMPMKIGLAV